MPSPSSSPTFRQELLSALAGATSLTNRDSFSSSPVLEYQEEHSSEPDSAPVQYHYEALKDEPSAEKILKPSSRARRSTRSSHRGDSNKCCLPPPRQSEVHLFAVAEDILLKVEQELRSEAALEQERSEHSSSSSHGRRLRRRSSELRHVEILRGRRERAAKE